MLSPIFSKEKKKMMTPIGFWRRRRPFVAVIAHGVPFLLPPSRSCSQPVLLPITSFHYCFNNVPPFYYCTSLTLACSSHAPYRRYIIHNNVYIYILSTHGGTSSLFFFLKKKSYQLCTVIINVALDDYSAYSCQQ
jgi:hypothetical protein